MKMPVGKSALAVVLMLTFGIPFQGAVAREGGPMTGGDSGQGMMGQGMGMMQGGQMDRGMEHEMMNRGMGMHGGGMMGMHMGGLGRFYDLDLTQEQRARLKKIQGDLRRKIWPIMGKMMDEKEKLSDLYGVDKPDPRAIGQVYGAMFDLKRQIIERTIEAKNSARAMLTPAQVKQMKGSGHHMKRGARAPGGMMGGGRMPCMNGMGGEMSAPEQDGANQE